MYQNTDYYDVVKSKTEFRMNFLKSNIMYISYKKA